MLTCKPKKLTSHRLRRIEQMRNLQSLHLNMKMTVDPSSFFNAHTVQIIIINNGDDKCSPNWADYKSSVLQQVKKTNKQERKANQTIAYVAVLFPKIISEFH